nr:hypothetical protein [Pseudanabaena sp. PCC 6802]
MILEEIEDEALWDEAFARSPDLLEQLAAEAISEYQAGKVSPTRCRAVHHTCVSR